VVASFALIAFSLAALVVLARALVASSYAEALVLSFVAAFTFVVVSVEVLAAFHSLALAPSRGFGGWWRSLLLPRYFAFDQN